jgi:acyl-CoA thioesterase-1
MGFPFLMHKVMALSLAAVLASGTACSNGASAATGPSRVAEKLKIVALGDSLTSGHGIGRTQAYPSVLEEKLREAALPFVVSNHGVSGDTTAGGLRRLENALAEKPQILIVALGANDGLRGVPVADVRRNLERIIEGAQARGASVLLCGMDALPIYGWQYTMDFHQIYPDLAAKYNVPLVPFLLTGVIANQAMLLPDMIHPNPAGAKAIAANIWPYLQPLAASLVATN